VLGLADAAGPLMAYLQYESAPDFQAIAASSLADIARRPDTGPTIAAEIRKALLEATKDRSRQVREAAFGALVRLPKPPQGLAEKIFESLYEEDPASTLDLIAKMGPAGGPAGWEVESALENPEPIVRWRAILCMVKIQAGRFSQMLSDPTPYVRATAAAGLRARGRRSLLANSAQLEKAVRQESDDSARHAIDAAWNALQEAGCAEEWFDSLEIEVSTPPVTEENLRIQTPPGKDLQTRLSEYVYILASPSGELTVELASDVSRKMIAGEIGEENPWFVVYQEDHSDHLLAGARRSVLRIKSQAELMAIVDAANPGWKERLENRPPTSSKPVATRPDRETEAP
jgi:hypothetical protein